MVQLHKYSGAGNDFVVLDGRTEDVSAFRSAQRIAELCDRRSGFVSADGRIGADGLMILTDDPDYDFRMEYYNSDGSGGMMCGNGGRCIVAFADYLGLRPAAADGTWLFRAPDGLHTATLLDPPEVSLARRTWIVRLKMIDVQGITPMKGGYFLNTGTRHFVRFVDDVASVDIEKEGYALRWDPAFQPEGTNVNFVQVAPDGLHVRTFEKGVEGETLACGTGLTASAIAAYVMAGTDRPSAGFRLQCRRGDWLQVDFRPGANNTFTDVYLTGPAEKL